ncbi:MAG: restriction endonuclease [Geminicoccaceae bacterium]
MKTDRPFDEQPPRRNLGPKPAIEDNRYRPQLGVLGHVFRSIRRQRIADIREQFESDHADWQRRQNQIKAWEDRRSAHLTQQAERRIAMEDLNKRYKSREQSAIEEHAELVLSRSEYFDFVPKEFEVQFVPSPGRILVKRYLPDAASIPTLKKITYVKSRSEFRENHIPDKEKNDLYKSIIYQICLRTQSELSAADEINAYELLIFNGHVRFVDPSTGRDAETCSVSLKVEKSLFAELDLRRVDPGECFDRLQGRGHPNLRGYEPIMPFMQLVTEDERFIDPQDVLSSLPDKANLASISWGEFEHLIRDLFEKEFASTAAAVRVTRVSRDGGVDVVVLDTDAVRGGKIMIQGKHYFKPVGVNAVRELYGVVINERATKGLLVTTSHFTAAAHEAVKNLPIYPVDQPELIALLEKHGHSFRVNRGERPA